MSIIEEALKKAARERDMARRYPSKFLTPSKKASYKSEAERPKQKPEIFLSEFGSSNVRYSRNKTLVIFGILLLAIIFLTITSIFLLSPVDIEEATSMKTSDDFTNTPLKGEPYSDVKKDVNLIEERVDLINKMAKVFKIESTQEEFLSNFTLNGIVYDDENSWAIINNKVVRVGDTFDGAKVISIAPRKVTLLFRNERFDLAVK